MTASSGCDRVDAKAEQHVADARPQRLQPRQASSRCLRPSTRSAGRRVVEHRRAQDHGIAAGAADAAMNARIDVGRMLPVRIHGQHVAEAVARGLAHARRSTAAPLPSLRGCTSTRRPGRPRARALPAPRRCRRCCRRPRPRPGPRTGGPRATVSSTRGPVL